MTEDLILTNAAGNDKTLVIDPATPQKPDADDATCELTVVSSVPSIEALTSASDVDGSGSVASNITDPLAPPAAPEAASPAVVAVGSGRTSNLGGSKSFVEWQSGDMLYSELLQDGLRYLADLEDKPAADLQANVVMLYESPDTAETGSSFFNSQLFPIHDYPPNKPAYKKALVPLRYSMMNGSAFPSYLQGEAPACLLEHWKKVLPEVATPTFVSEIKDDDQVYAYLPQEHVKNHVNDPHVHYHLAGKDALHLMTPNTPKSLANTKDVRPCIVKVNHSMGSKGIFVIQDDDDEQEMNDFLSSTGNPKIVITDFVDIARNVSCHFFIHPSGEIVWIGSSENYRGPDGNWSMDSIIVMDEQDELRDLQLPYAREIADYCLSLGFWGFCGIDCLFDPTGRGYIVDVNPRTTGTSPALMAAKILQSRCGYGAGLFRRSSSFAFPGSLDQLMSQVEAFNTENDGDCTVVLVSVYETSPTETLLNIGVHGHDMARCRKVLDRFARKL